LSEYLLCEKKVKRLNLSKMIYDKDFNLKYNLFTSDIRGAFNQYTGYEAIEVANMLYAKKGLSNENYFKIAHWGITRAIQDNDKITELKYIHATGFHHFKLGDYHEALMYYAQGLYISETINNPEFTARFQTSIGELSIQQTNYEKALDYYFKVMRIDDMRFCSETYSKLAEIYKEKEDYEVAIEYAEKAYDYNLKEGNHQQIMQNLIVIADINFAKEKYGEALNFYAKALKVHYLYPDPYFATVAVMRSADVLFNLGHYKEAQASYEYAAEISNTYGLKFNSVLIAQKRAQTYSKQGNYTKALEINDTALKQSRNFNFDLLELNIIRDKVTYHEAQDELDIANGLLRESEALNIYLIEKEQREKLQEIIEEKEKELNFYKTQARSMAAASDDLRQYAKVIAHDLKEPLRTIGSFNSLLKRKYHKIEEEEVGEYFEFIMDATLRMGDLLDELLRYVVLGIKDKAPKNVNLNEVAQHAVRNLEDIVKAKKAIINIQELPTVLGQKQHFRELFYRLLHNALRYNDSQPPIIDITVKRNQGEYLFTVSDNGIGIAEDYYEKIFLLYHKLNKEDKEGVGIGLAMSKKIVELHGGSIWISSTVGKGTSIEFTLKDL